MTYCCQSDFGGSYALALRMLALRHGSVRVATVKDKSWCAKHFPIVYPAARRFMEAAE
mgnify:CR=1 FL=1